MASTRKSLAAVSAAVIAQAGLLFGDASSASASATATCSDQAYSSFVAEMRHAYDRISTDPAFAGIALLSRCGPIDIYATSALDATFQTSARAADPIGNFRFHRVSNGLVRLFQVQQAITSDFERLRTEGTAIFRYWPDMTTGRERIEVADATASQLSSLVGRYGAQYVDAVSVSRPALPIPTYDPSNDSPPWYGGDYIEWTDSGLEHDCSEAFGVHNSQHQFLLTAGHCSARGTTPITGESWINAVTSDQYGDLSGSLTNMGTVVYNSLGGEVDSALIQTSSYKQEWFGWYTSAHVVYQAGAARAGVGQTVCVNGAYEGTICSGVVQQSGYLGCQYVSGYAHPWCDLIQATNSGGSVIVGEGDSGGGGNFAGADILFARHDIAGEPRQSELPALDVAGQRLLAYRVLHRPAGDLSGNDELLRQPDVR
jgi:hypothetical protein